MEIIRRTEHGTKEIRQKVRLVRENAKTVWVELPNGDVIKRHKRDVVL